MEGEDTEVAVETADESQTSVEETPQVPGSDTAATERKTLDELFATEPDFLKAYESTLEEHPVTQQDLESLDATGRRVVAGMLKRAKDGVPELEQEKRALAQERMRLEALERIRVQREADLLKPFVDPKARAFVDGIRPREEEPEAFTAEWFDWKLKHGIADHFGRFMETFQSVEQERNAAAEAARLEQEHEEKVQAAEQYIEENRESFDDPRVFDRVQELVQLTKGAMKIEDAHRIAMLEVTDQDTATLKARSIALARQRIQRGGRGGPTLPDTPKDAEARDQFYKDNPNAVARDVAAYNQRRFS